MVVKIEISPEAQAVLSSVEHLPANMLAATAKAMNSENLETVSRIQRLYLNFPSDGPTVAIGCRHISGRLRNSLNASKAVVSGDTVSSAIGSNVSYAAAQEFGADIPPHVITPKPGNQALRFKIGDRVIFAKSVKFPGARLPARGFVQRGIADRSDAYTTAISKAILDAWNTK